MNSTYVLIALGGVAAGFLLSWFFTRTDSIRRASQVRQLDAAIQDRERDLHRRQQEHFQEISRLDKEKREAVQAERTSAFEDGRKLGKAEGQREHIDDLGRLQIEHQKQLATARREAADEARRKAREDFEFQAKLFTVEVRPFVQITEDTEYFKKVYDIQQGYQYQLYVNKIPAFQPHVIIESTERRKEVNEKNIKELVAQAAQLAQAALENSLGSVGKFGRVAEAVVRRLPRKGG